MSFACTGLLPRANGCPITGTTLSGKLPSPWRIVPMNMTEARYEALSALMPEGRYLLRRDSSKLTRADRITCLIRTNVIELVGHRERKLSEVHGQTAAWLLKDGLIEKVGDRPAHGELFQLSAAGRELFAKAEQIVKAGNSAPWVKKQRVTERMIAPIASRHECVVRLNVARKWFELVRKDGKELQMPTICHPKTKRHVRRLGDMTPTEWSAAIAKAAILKEPIEDEYSPEPENQGVHK